MGGFDKKLLIAGLAVGVTRAHALVHNAAEAVSFVDQSQYDGRATPMGDSLEDKILEKEFYPKLKKQTLRKPVLIIVIGDGQPTGESPDKFRREIKEAKKKAQKSKYGEDAISIQVAVVGNDSGARDWLEALDSDKDVGGLVDVCSDILIESAQVRRATGFDLSPELWALKVMMGSIDSSYDASDEVHSYKQAKRKEERQRKENEYSPQRARLLQERNAASGHYPAAASSGGFNNAATQQQQQQQHQRTPSGGGGGYPPAGGAPSPYPPAGGNANPYGAPPGPGGPPGGAPYPPPPGGGASPYPPSHLGGYPPAPGSGYPPAGGGAGYPPAGGAGYPPPAGGAGYPPPGGPHAPPPPAYSRGLDGGNGGFSANVGGFMMPSPNFGGPQPPQQQPGGAPGFPQGPSFPQY
ncbi:hypothetical protein V8E36_002966 [Tilletia maclaganii]